MEASAGSDGQQQEPVMEPAEQDLQLDQAEPDVESQARSQTRMTEDEVLEPPYGEPESLGPSAAGVSPGQQGEALPEVVSQEPRGEEVLASLRPAEAIPAVAVEESPESWRRSESRQSEETRLQQLTSVLETLVQGQQALNNRLERVEEVRSSHSWRSAESSQGLGWVDHTALDRWYTEATARAAASGHRDATMYIAGDVQSFPRHRSATTKATISVEGESTEELTGATIAPPALPPGTKLQVRIDGHLRDVVVNDSGGLEAGAVLAGDWLAAVAPLMRQLSPSAQTWWAQNLKEAEDHYERLEKQRGAQLLLKAVPEAFRTDLIATRTLAVNAIVFAILCRWQPGGKLERAQVLDYLVHPEASGSVEETVEGIRKWRRMVLRASELGAVLPDSSLLLKGLDTLTQPGLGDHPVVSFRVAAYRNESSVDFAPTQAKVAELAEYLLAEYEALSIQEDPRAQGPKRQRAAAVKAAAKAEARTGPSASTPSAKSADSGPKGGKGSKGSGKGGKTKKGEGAAKLQKAQELTSEEAQDATSGAQPTTTADLLKEATEVIRSLKLKALVVRQGRFPPERALEVATEGLEGTGLLDTGASTSMRQARPGELDAGCELRNVNLAVGTVKLFVNPGGTLLSTEDIDPLVSVADLVDMGCQLSWCGQECILTHPERGTIRPSTLNRCPEVPRELALELIGDIEVYRKAQRIVIKALRDEAASLSSQDFAVLQHRLCQAARGDDKVGVLMSAWLSHKFGDLPACLVDSIALHPSGIAGFGGLVNGMELCEPDTWRYLLKLAVDGKLRGVIGTAPADFNLCDTSLPVESRDDLARGRQTLALMVLLELAACFYEPLVCLGHPSGQPAGIVKFPKVILERQLNRVLCKGKVDLFTNAELPSETLCDAPSFAPEATLWSGCVQEAISVVVRSAVELQTGMLSRATAFRAAGAKVDASFRQHLAHDHIPWRRDCRHCVEGPQQDQVTAQDPYQDVSGEAEAPDLPSDVDCEEYAPSLPGEPLLDEDLDGLWAHEKEGPMDWEQAEEDSREFVCATDAELREEEIMSREWADQEKEHLRTSKMYELPFAVPLPNKREETVLDGIAFMITQIQALGYCVTRFQSDRGREFCNKRLRSFLRHRGIFKTTSEGDHYQQNGRVEGMINRIKRQARVLMTAASVEHRYWPFALQHVAARMRLMITTTLLTEVMDPAEPVPSEKGDMQPLHRDLPIDERPVPIISHRIPTKRTVRTVREVSPVLQEEDAEGFVALLSRLVKECAPEARWTTLALLVEVGGGVWCQAEKGGDQRCLNNGKMIAGKLWPLQVLVPFELDPRKFHASQTWSEGSRVVLVAYSLTAIQRAEQSTVWRLRQAGFQLPREAPSEAKPDYDCVEREPTVQIEELGATAPLDKSCPRVAKLDTNDRADVAVPTPVWRQRFTVLDELPMSDELAEAVHWASTQGVTPEQFFAMRERVSGLSFIQRIIVEQAEAERQLAGERVAALRAPSGAAPQNETEGDASEEEGRSDDDVVAGDWEDLEGERVEEGAHFFEELDRCQLRLQAAVKRESNLHVQAVVCDSANGGGRAESLRSAAQQVEHATQDLQHSYDEVLQTHVVPNAVVERDPSEWVGPMREEYEGLQRAVKPLSEATLEQWRREGTPCEVIPAKVICSIKAPKGRRKVRCVCCGNFARSDRWSRADTYSGGIDAVYNDTVVFLTVHGPNVRVAGHRTNPDWGAINVETQLAEGSVPVYGPAAGTDSQPVQGLMHTHSRCDLAYSVSVISAWMTKYPTAAIERGIKVLRYLKAYPEVCLKYGTAPNDKGPEGALKVERSESLVEGYSDASFAPESSRSHGAFLTVWAGATVNWCSKKQAYMTMSTCESELGALSDSGQAVISICPLINEFLWGRAKVQPMALLQEQGHLAPRTQVVLYTDNTASVAVVSLPGGTWRTRHLRIKGAWLQEQAAHETFVRYGDDAMMAFPAQRRGQASSSAGAWLEPTRVPRPTQDPHEEAPSLPLCVTSAGGCYHRMGCSQLVHCTNVSSYEPCARCITDPTLKWVSSQTAMWFWTSRYHAAGCTLRHNGGTRYVPCRHCLPGVRNRRGNRGG
ncbi:unnamed protein product [Symbiodinium sp. KB8]|nr:unnamed protein product [Symbiodinium sp. KB8]